MPDIYDIDFSKQAEDLMPPDKRPSKFMWAAIMVVLQWCRDLVLGSFKTGATAAPWAAGAYNMFSQVKYQNGVWYALKDTSATPGTDATAWLQIQKNFLGADERVKYSGVSLVLEYALNHEFGGTFRQPGSSSRSDIYCVRIGPELTGFRIGDADGSGGGSALGANNTTDSIGGPLPFAQLHSFTIMILTALYTATTEEAIRDFVNIYIPVSINYTITTY